MKRTILLYSAVTGTQFAFAHAETPRIPLPDEIRDDLKKHQGACADWPNLTDVRATIGGLSYYITGSEARPTGGVLELPVHVSVVNDAVSDAPSSELGYSAEIWSAGGELVEKTKGEAAIARIAPYATADATVRLEIDNVVDLIMGDRTLRGTLVFRVKADAPGAVGECDENDNTTELREDFAGPEASWGAPSPRQPD